MQVSSRSNVRCHFSGAESKYIDAAAKWVAVPDVMLSPAVYSPLGPFIAVNESESEGTGSGVEKVREEKVERSAVTEDDGCTSLTTASGTEKEKEKESDKRSTRIRVSTFLSQAKDKERSSARQQPVALESATLKVAAAREMAFLQRQKQEVRTHMCHIFMIQ